MVKIKLYSENTFNEEINEWISFCSAICKNTEKPKSIVNQNEYFLSILAAIWLIKFLFPNNSLTTYSDISNSINCIKVKYPNSCSLWEYIELIFETLQHQNVLDQLLSKKIPDLSYSFENDSFGTILQQSLTLEYRKKIAANYTNIKSANILIELAETQGISEIIDPFCGSGRLITTYLNSLNPRSKFPNIRISDIMPSAVLLASCRIILLLTKAKKDFSLLESSIGDAFSLFGLNETRKYDLLLMNPPFTRTHRIDSHQRIALKMISKKYEKYISGQIGLHIYALFLADLLVKKGGFVAAILPAATILSKYSSGIHEFLLNNYKNINIATSVSKIAHSEESSFKEILFVAKHADSFEKEKINFIRINEKNHIKNWEVSSIQRISKEKLRNEWNWTFFLRDPDLLNLRKKILKSNLVKNGKSLRLDIVRGVEMYGPNFFFIPNRKWEIIEENEENIIIQSKQNELSIPKKFLVRILRKPGNYSKTISPQVKDYVLSLTGNNIIDQNWFQTYLNTTKKFTMPAKSKFGNNWFSHIYNQLNVKRPLGHLFIIDKFSVSSTSVLCHYIDTELPCSKNFYVFRHYPLIQSKLLAAWLNSTFFLILFLVCRREIGGSYGRLQIVDYMKERLFLDFSKCEKTLIDQILREFDKIRISELPSIPFQTELQLKKSLDLEIAKTLHFKSKEAEFFLNNAYITLKKIFEDFQFLDKK